MKFAVIETGGKQYLVKSGDILKIEKISSDMEPGAEIVFDKVLLFGDGDKVVLGSPYIDGATVSASLVSVGRNKKVTILKYKQKSRYRIKTGHRQPFFEVKVGSLN